MPARVISILGCGWLGFPLAKHLVDRQYIVQGATTSVAKIPPLENARVKSFLIKFAPQARGKDVRSFFRADTLFLNIPFDRHLQDPYFYKRQIESVVECVHDSPVKFVIFAGSTAVYPETLADASEIAVFNPDNPRARVLGEIEQLLLSDLHFKSTVIRFGGLYGPQRPIGRFMAGKKSIPGGNKPVNLIHRDDCVGIVTAIIERDIYGETFNAVSDAHPSRRELYTAAAVRLGLPAPEFMEEPPRTYKVVSNQKIKKALNYAFRHPDPAVLEEDRDG